jgi:hypothetical protein
VKLGTVADAAAHGELVANTLDHSQGMPPSLLVANTDPLGERIQRAFPATRVVKALNPMKRSSW